MAGSLVLEAVLLNCHQVECKAVSVGLELLQAGGVRDVQVADVEEFHSDGFVVNTLEGGEAAEPHDDLCRITCRLYTSDTFSSRFQFTVVLNKMCIRGVEALVQGGLRQCDITRPRVPLIHLHSSCVTRGIRDVSKSIAIACKTNS